MRLIDADKLRKEIHMSYSDDLGIREMIDEQPTAYDADKVIEQLENLRDRFDSEDFHIRGILEKSIEIVKSGGVADD